MQITKKQLSPTSIKLTIVADKKLLAETKEHVLRDMGRNVKLAGFRAGKAPLTVVEKNVDQNLLQSEFLDHVINSMYSTALVDEKLRPVSQPQVSIGKFV